MKMSPRSFMFVAFSAAGASALSLIGGVGLEAVASRILPIVPLLIAIPGLNDLVGDYASIIAAHHGDPTENTRTKKQLLFAIFRVVGLNILFLVILSAVLAQIRGYILEPVFLIKFAIFIAVAVVLAILIMFALAGSLELILKNKRINPDELLIPIVTSLADIVMLLFVALAVITVF